MDLSGRSVNPPIMGRLRMSTPTSWQEFLIPLQSSLPIRIYFGCDLISITEVFVELSFYSYGKSDP
jgi:hypothetical protein